MYSPRCGSFMHNDVKILTLHTKSLCSRLLRCRVAPIPSRVGHLTWAHSPAAARVRSVDCLTANQPVSPMRTNTGTPSPSALSTYSLIVCTWFFPILPSSATAATARSASSLEANTGVVVAIGGLLLAACTAILCWQASVRALSPVS